MSVDIHSTAIVESGAELDDGVSIGAYSIIGPNVKIGKNTRVLAHAVVNGHTTLGANNLVYNFAAIGNPPQDLKYKGEPTILSIGDGNTVREFVTIQPGTVHGHGRTTVGNNNLLMANSHVAHDCIVGNGNVFANSVALAGHVTIRDHVILGGLCAIHQFAILGDLSFIGGGAMVAKDVPPFAMVQGDRAKIVGVNVVGVRRAGFKAEDLKVIRSVFKEVFLNVGDLNQRLGALSEEVRANPIAIKLITFLQESKRGICAPRSLSTDGDDGDLD